MATKKTRNASMKDVARAAGVSQPAVSYAYNRPSKISDAQRNEIFAIARKIGYPGPNALGRSLRSGKVGAIGVMMMDKLSLAFDDPAMIALLKGIGQSGEFENMALTLSKVIDRRIPFVVVDSPKLKTANFVGIDDYAAAQTQMRHLIDLGHRKIGVLIDRLNPDGHSGYVTRERFLKSKEAVVRERLRGYIDAAADIGLDFRSLRIYEAGELGLTAGQAAAFNLLTSNKITAVVATSDVMALACLEAAKDLDIEVPRKLSIVGFDDIPEALQAGLTTIRQPMVEKGIVAAKMIIGLVNDPDKTVEPKRRLFDTRLVIRRSTATI